jgi:hypothetical protein
MSSGHRGCREVVEVEGMGLGEVDGRWGGGGGLGSFALLWP